MRNSTRAAISKATPPDAELKMKEVIEDTDPKIPALASVPMIEPVPPEITVMKASAIQVLPL